ncbi:MAG TPA: cyclic nucleotide-binding domain-containing protein [Bdellovibrionota bacterium]|nr:cyclic nucleotide-binding domain-containing protein [Bdellovibrionota bacterium]
MANELAPYIVKFRRDDTVFTEGDPGNEMYFVHSGRVRIQKDIDGKPEVLAVMEKGDFFGEMALLDHMPRTATAIIEEDSELLKVDSGNFEKLLQNNIEIAVRMIRKYASRLRDATMRLEMELKDRKAMDRGIQEILESVKAKPSEVTPPGAILASFVGDKAAGTFQVNKEVSTIGREDPVTKIVPDIDLTLADKTRSVSRRHARLERVSGQFLLTEEVGVRNGTFVHGERLKPGTPITLTDGAKVTFGQVDLSFKVAKS